MRAAVAAGYEVIAADVFCDQDTCRDAFMAIPLPYVNGGFSPESFRKAIFPLLNGNGVAFIYGSGFETQPDLLDQVAQHCPIIGNSASAIRAAKDPQRFFALLTSLDIPCPEFALDPPAFADGWLRKLVGGSGGTHIVGSGRGGGEASYFQRLVPGVPVSLLFLTDGSGVREVGFNRQVLAPASDMPYRYGGAVSQVDLAEPVRQGMKSAAHGIASAFGLRGLNSLDCMVEGDRFWVLEVNPRLSATFSLYDHFARGARLFEAHVQACAGSLADVLPSEQAQAHLIYYADNDVTIPQGMIWPEWVADIPEDRSRIRAGEPLCTVMAAGDVASQAEMLARSRLAQLTNRINQIQESIR